LFSLACSVHSVKRHSAYSMIIIFRPGNRSRGANLSSKKFNYLILLLLLLLCCCCCCCLVLQLLSQLSWLNSGFCQLLCCLLNDESFFDKSMQFIFVLLVSILDARTFQTFIARYSSNELQPLLATLHLLSSQPGSSTWLDLSSLILHLKVFSASFSVW